VVAAHEAAVRPAQNLCQDAIAYETSYIAARPYVGRRLKMKPDPAAIAGEFSAWDPVARKKAWSIKEDFPVWSGALVTAATSCSTERWTAGSRRSTRRAAPLLWKYKTSSGIIGQPVSYRAPDGISTSRSSRASAVGGAVVSGDLDTRDGTAGGRLRQRDAGPAACEQKGGMLYVFRLP
jgi:hypothetical protein